VKKKYEMERTNLPIYNECRKFEGQVLKTTSVGECLGENTICLDSFSKLPLVSEVTESVGKGTH